jgi:Asp-tRNA(Asn)/Glu-tRNA(Gln) amidotransferase A subunit family amidase
VDTHHSEDQPSGFSRREFCKLGVGVLGTAALSSWGVPFASAATFTDDELIYMSAAELIPLFKSRKLSPVEVLKAQIARYKKVNDDINCITYTHFYNALRQAKESENRYKNGTARTLEGITIGVKDEHHDAGWIVTQGSKLFKNDKKDHADVIVAKLKAAGAVLPIQTMVPEFYLNGVTWSDLWGVTRCPWNLEYTVGGSSGGSGGALAAGLCTLATGSDMGGSIRLPCAYNGLYGFKPPFGRVHSDLPLSYFSGSGPMARTFDDMVMMQNAISGQAPYGPSTLPKLEMPMNYPGIKGMRIAYSPGLGLTPLDKDTQGGMTKASTVLSDLGVEVEEVSIDPGFTLEELIEIFSIGVLSGPMGGMLAKLADRVNGMTTYAAYFVKRASSRDYNNLSLFEYERRMKNFHTRIANAVFNKGYDALLMPTLATPHIPADFDFTKDNYTLNEKELPGLFIGALTLPWNILNWYPVVNVPTVLSSQGMPMGMQIIGKPYDDQKVFQIAHNYDAAAPRLFTGDLTPKLRKASVQATITEQEVEDNEAKKEEKSERE